MTREIDLTSDVLLSQQGGALDTLRLISKGIPESDWCLIGGLMTYLVLREHSAGTHARASQTKDADLVVETVNRSAHRAAHELVSMGFKQLEPFFGQTERQARYRMGTTMIDVLAPDDTAEADLILDNETVTLAAPGGRRALEVSTLVTVYYGSDGLAEFRVPTIGHAIVVKAAAVMDPRTQGQVRHVEDVVEMLAALQEPTEWASSMTANDKDLLEQITPRVVAVGNRESTTALQLLVRAIPVQ